VIGVMVEAGIVKEGTPICVPSKDVSRLDILLPLLLLLLLLVSGLIARGDKLLSLSLFLRLLSPSARSPTRSISFTSPG